MEKIWNLLSSWSPIDHWNHLQVFGLMTKPLIRILLPSPKNRMLSSEPSTPKSLTVPLLTNGHDLEAYESDRNLITRPTSLRMFLSTPSNTVHYYWRKFDNAFMRPVFGGRGFVPFVPGSPIEQNDQQWQWIMKRSQIPGTKILH